MRPFVSPPPPALFRPRVRRLAGVYNHAHRTKTDSGDLGDGIGVLPAAGVAVSAAAGKAIQFAASRIRVPSFKFGKSQRKMIDAAKRGIMGMMPRLQQLSTKRPGQKTPMTVCQILHVIASGQGIEPGAKPWRGHERQAARELMQEQGCGGAPPAGVVMNSQQAPGDPYPTVATTDSGYSFEQVLKGALDEGRKELLFQAGQAIAETPEGKAGIIEGAKREAGEALKGAGPMLAIAGLGALLLLGRRR